MTTRARFSDVDNKLKMLVNRRGLSEGAIKNYNTVFDEIFELFGVTPSDLINIAKKDQKPYIDNETGNLEILDLEDRTITKYQFEYYDSLKSKNLSNKTINLKLNTFRSLLTEYDIDKPKPIDIVIKTDRVRDEDIVSWREVETALSFCKGIRDKAIISFFVTTGLRSSDIRRLTIDDLIKACDIYFDENEEKTLNNLLSKNPDDLIPCWEIMPKKTDKKSQLAVTFNTPEASNYMWQYLNERIAKNIGKGEDGILKPDEPLFATSTKNFLKSTAIEQMFQRINKQLGDKKDKNGKYARFRSHSLRKLFSTTVRRNITQVVINSDKTSEVDIVSIFTGHVPPNESNSRVYEAIESDSHESYLRKTYTALIPYLSIKDIKVNDFSTPQYKEIEEEFQKMKEEYEAKDVQRQREIDDLKHYYEKKIRHEESNYKTLLNEFEVLKQEMDNVTHIKNMEIIQDYIKDNPTVNDFNLANKVMELYRLDIQNDKFLIVDTPYMDTLIARAYNNLPEYRTNNIRDDGADKHTDEWYFNLKNEILLIKDKFLESHNYLLSEYQINSIDDELINYCDKLWWEYTYKPNEAHVQELILKIAKG